MDKINLDINTYTVQELYDLFKLKDSASLNDITSTTNNYIQKYKESNNEPLTKFLTESQEILLNFKKQENRDVDHGNMFLDHEYLPHKGQMLATNIPNRAEYTHLVSENHPVIDRQRLPIGQGKGIPIAQGQLNPHLRNIHTRVINIDSKYTDHNHKNSSNFLIDFSEPLANVYSLSLNSLELMLSYYIFDETYGTNCLYVDTTKVTINEGNYSNADLCSAVGTAMGGGLACTVATHNNKVTIANTTGGTVVLTFYDIEKSGLENAKIDYNLGYLLGFRDLSYSIPHGASIVSEGLIDTYGPRYLLLCVDDHKKNRINSNIVSVYDSLKKFDKPLIICDQSYSTVQTYVNDQKTLSANTPYPNKYLGITPGDVLAKIPIARSDLFETIIMYNNGDSLLSSTRKYFGSTNIERLRIKLLNDKGQEVNLNNMHYSLSLLCESVYQY